MMTTIPFNISTPSGRAIQHLLDTVLAEHLGQGIEVRWSGGDDRLIVIHPQMGAADDGSIASLRLLLESLSGYGAVNLAHLYGVTDADQREHIALAVFMAAGYDVNSTPGRRRAS